MFASGIVTFFFVALVALNVVGYPVTETIGRALAERGGPAPFEPIRAYVVDVKRQDTGPDGGPPLPGPGDITHVNPDESIPVQSLNGTVEPFNNDQGP